MPLQQEAGHLGAIEKEVIRPLQRKTWRADPCDRLDRLMQREPGYEAELRRRLHIAWIDQEQSRVEVTEGRRPLPAMPPPPRKLLGRCDPELSRIAGPSGLESVVVRRVRRLKREKPITRGLGLRRQIHDQNNERAAAPAALTIGAGTNQNSSTTALDTTRTKVTPGDMRSNRSTGSSKYMTLTMRR